MRLKSKISYFSAFTLGIAMFLLLSSDNAYALEVVDPSPGPSIVYDEPVGIYSSVATTLPSYFFQGMHIGQVDGDGGVLFANGTIVNITRTIEDNNPIPVTFGDDLRIDGEIWRGLYKGTAIDNMPLKISDTMVPTMDDINDLGDRNRRWQDLYLSGSLQGNDARFTGIVDFSDATVKGISGADLLASENTWTGNNIFEGDIDFTNANLIGLSGADLLSSNNTWTGNNVYQGDVDFTGANVIGLTASGTELYISEDSDSYLTVPTSNPTANGKILIGMSLFSCAMGGWQEKEIDIPAGMFQAQETVMMTTTQRDSAADNELLDVSHYTDIPNNKIYIRGDCPVAITIGIVDWMAIGY